MLPHQLAITERGAPFLPGFVRGGDFNSVNVGTAIQLMWGTGLMWGQPPPAVRRSEAPLQCSPYTTPHLRPNLEQKRARREPCSWKQANSD